MSSVLYSVQLNIVLAMGQTYPRREKESNEREPSQKTPSPWATSLLPPPASRHTCYLSPTSWSSFPRTRAPQHSDKHRLYIFKKPQPPACLPRATTAHGRRPAPPESVARIPATSPTEAFRAQSWPSARRRIDPEARPLPGLPDPATPQPGDPRWRRARPDAPTP